MPDITDRIGLDSIDQKILEQNTQDRFNKLFSDQPVLPNANSALSPLFAQFNPQSQGGGYNPNLKTPADKTPLPELDQSTKDKLKNIQAMNMTQQLLAKNDPRYYGLTRGMGETQYLPYKPLQKYLGEDMGFKPQLGMDLLGQINFNEDAYASIKNTVLKGIGKFLGRTVVGAVGKAGEGLAYLGGLATGIVDPTVWYDMLVNKEDYLTAAGDNVFSRAFNWLDNDFKNKMMPVYQESSSMGKGFWYRLTHDGSFWMNDVSDGAAFALSAFVPALAVSKLGIGARAFSALSKTALGDTIFGENALIGAKDIYDVQKGTEAATSYLKKASQFANFVDKSTTTVANTISESYFESRDTYNTVLQNELEKGTPEPVAKKKAQDASKGVFWANIPALLFSNAFEAKLQFKALGYNEIEDGVTKGIRQAGAFGAYTAEEPVTNIGKFLASPIGFYAKHLPEAILKEGYWEENIQQAIQRYYQNTDNQADGIFGQIGGILKNYANQTWNSITFSGKDPETDISIGLGALMGSTHTVISSALANEYKNNKDLRNQIVDHVNQLQNNWLKYGDPYERDDSGAIVQEQYTKEDGSTGTRNKVSIPKLAAYSLKINELAERLNMSDEVKHEVLNDFMKKSLFSELVLANINANTYNQFIDNLKNSKDYSEEDLAKLGLQKTENYNQWIDDHLKLASKIKSLDKSIAQDVIFKKVNSKEDVQDERNRRNELLRNGTLQILLTDQLQKLGSEYSDLEGKLNSKYKVGSGDNLVSRLNALQSRIRYNEQFVNNPDYDSTDISTATELLDNLNKEKAKLLEDNEDILKGVTKDKDGYYRYEDKEREQDPDFIRFKKIQNRLAQLDNAKKIIGKQWYKLADIDNGLDYYRSDRAEKEKQAEERLQKLAEEQDKAKQPAAITEDGLPVTDNPFLKHQEQQAGDFVKVSSLATRMALDEEITDEDSNNLFNKYQNLIKELVPLYRTKLSEIRKAQLEKKIKILEEQRDKAVVEIIEKHRKIGSLDRQAEEIIQEYKNAQTASAKNKLRKVIKGIQEDINKLEAYIRNVEPKIAEYDNRIQLAQQELESNPTIKNVLDTKAVVEKEKEWVTNEIENTKGLINKLKALLRQLVNIAKELFIGFNPLGERVSTYEENVDKGRHEALEAEAEILSEAVKLQKLRETLSELESEYKYIDNKLGKINNEIAEFKKLFNQYTSGLRAKASLTREQALSTKPVYSPEEKALNAIYSQELGTSGPINTIPFDRNIYDGDGYLRNLEYLFQASTDPNQGTGDARTEAHLSFLNNIAQLSTSEFKEKLGQDGKLELFYVTGNNVTAFGMEDMIDSKYLDTSNIATTGVFLVYVIRRGDNTYFVDKELNILDKVGELKPENKSNIVYGTLRNAEWRDSDFLPEDQSGKRINRYDLKYPPGSTEKALEAGIKFRQKVLDESKGVTPSSLVTHPFTITRGIPNRTESLDAGFVKNSVTDSLIKESDINPDVLVVPTIRTEGDFEIRTVHGLQQRLPVGRPLLLTKNGQYAQYHYLDNNMLTEDQQDAVKHVLYNLAKEFSQNVEEQLTKLNNGVPVEKNTPLYFAKLGQLAKTRRELGLSLINIDYINYLKGILYFRPLADDVPVAKADPRQIWLRGDAIYLGNTGHSIPINDPQAFLNSPELDNFLSNYHHNVNTLSEDKKTKSFTEYYVEGKDLKNRQWTSYAHYMLASNRPDGTKRTDIPLTTSIKTREQAEFEYNNQYFPYIQRASVITQETQDAIQKNKFVSAQRIQEQNQEGVALIDEALGSKPPAASPLAKLLGQNKPAEPQQPAAQTTPAAPAKTVSPTELLAKLGEQKPTTTEQLPPSVNPVTGQPGKTSSIDPNDEDAASDLMGMGSFRVVTSKEVKPEANMDFVKAEIKRMIPQLPVELVDRLIDAGFGRQAWGTITKDAIILYKDAEEGSGFHEAFEGFINLLATDKEWKDLYKEFQTRKGTFLNRETGQYQTYQSATPHEAKEQLAEEFRDYKLEGRVWRGEKIKMNFFQKILNWIKSLFTHMSSIEKTFADLDKGIYSNRPLANNFRFQERYRLTKNIPEVYFDKLIQGATAMMFKDVFLSNKSFTDFDSDHVDMNKLYAKLKKDLTDYYEARRPNAEKMKTSNPSVYSSFMSAYEAWKSAEAQWDNFVEDHKSFLRPFRIKFVPDFENEDENKDEANTNRNDYTASIMEIDAKKTAATSVRLLFATLIASRFRVRGGQYEIDEKGNPVTEPAIAPANSMYLPELANYDEIIKSAFNNLTSLNNISRIEEALKDAAGINEINRAENKQDAIARLDNRQAVLYNLYQRVFGQVKEHDEETRQKMRVKLNNFLAKQNPNAKLMMVTSGGAAYFIESNTKEAYELLRRKANAHLKGMLGKNFARQAQDKKVWYKTPQVNVYNLNTIEEFNKVIGAWFDLGEEFSSMFLKSLSAGEFENLSNKLRSLLSVIKTKNDSNQITSLSLDGLGIEGRINDIIRFYINKTTSGTDSSFSNINNKQQQNYVLNNYISRVVSDINYVKTKDELLEENPHLGSTFASDSLVLSRLFDEEGNRNGNKLVHGYTEGIKRADDREGKKNSALPFIDRLILSFNSNLAGTYYTLLPADSETEWDLQLGEFIEYSNNFEDTKKKDIIDTLSKYLETEIRIAQENRISDLQQVNAKYTDGTRIGDTLRIFRDVIKDNDKLLRTIEKGIEENTDPGLLIKQNQKAIGNAIMVWLNNQARKNTRMFMDNGIIEQEGIAFRFNLLYDKFAERLGKERKRNDEEGKEGYFFTEKELQSMMLYHATNYFIANMEMFKLFFGDPAQYKDLTKRIKSFTSGVEWSYYEKEEEQGDKGLNGFLNENKNNAYVYNDKGDVVSNTNVPMSDMFYYRHKNYLNLQVVQDLIVADPELYNQLVDPNFKDLVNNLAKAASTYANINEADAQSVTDIQTYREIMIKSGWRWTQEHENQYQYEMAYARHQLAKKQKYTYPNEELKAADDSILARYPNHPALAAFTPIKPLYAGVDNDSLFKMRLLKTSIYPITYRLAESREMEDLYLKMLDGSNNARVNIFTFESSQKVGLTLDKNNQITPLYNPEKVGEINDFNKAKTPISQLSYKHFGIQVETQSSGKGNTLGTQATKDIKLNLFDDGAPVDFIEAYTKTGKTKNDALVTFYNMSEQERVQNSQFYKLYREHEIALSDLKSAGYRDLLIKIGATETLDSKGNPIYTYKDLSKIHKILEDEIKRRELDENTIESLGLTDDLQAFRRAPESMPSYDIVRNILYALVDKAILSPKVNGKPYIQVASSFFNNESRKAAYFDKESNKWVNINTEREHAEAVKAKRKIVYTSSELGFYKLIKDGKEVQAMEIMLPHIYKQEINEAREAKGLKPLNDKQIIEYLEREQPKLLEGVGFRIPTQATSSIEFFKIKGFLPETFGGAVVVPSAITAKSGSDFDVDKLNTYLNNWELDKNGLPRYVEFKDDTNSTIEERHMAFIKAKYARVINPFRAAIAKVSEKVRKNSKAIKVLEDDIKTFEDLFRTSKGFEEAKFVSKIFGKTITDMQAAMAADEELRAMEIEGERLQEILDNAIDEYHETLKDIMEDMPLERFSKFSLAQQNSIEALENVYFQSLRNILSLPYNFQFLLSPNSNENIINNRNAIFDAEGRQAKDKDIHHSQFLDFGYMNLQRNYFVRGKQDIGIFAVAMTNYANAQVTGLVVAPITDIRKDNAFHLTELNQNSFKLPFNYNTIKVDGVEYISLGSRFDMDMQSVMDKISGYINGAVDVAKDPIIMDMGMLSELASVYILLERIGVPGETVALFMKQPIIRDYIHELQLRKSAIKDRSEFNNSRKIIEYLISTKYSTGEAYKYEDIKLNNEDMKRMLRKAAEASSRQTIPLKMTKEERHLQQLILANYLKAKVYADHLLETIQSSNHDTANIRSHYAIYKKNWQAQDSRKGNTIKALSRGQVVPGSDAIKRATFVGNDVNILNKLERLFGSKIFSLQKDNPARLIRYLGRKIYFATRFQGADEFNRSMRELEIGVLDYMANNANVLRADKPIAVKDLTGTLFLSSRTTPQGPINNELSLRSQYRQLMEQIKNTKNHPLSDNIFLQNIVFEEDPRAGIVTFTLKDMPKASDVYTRNRILEALRQLRDYEGSSRFYAYLMLGSIAQNGVGFKRSSINNLIPNEDYGEQINEGLKNIDKHDFSDYEEILARTNLENSLVEKPKVNQLMYVNINPQSKEANLVFTDWQKDPSKLASKNFFGKEPIPPAVFVYGGRDSINDNRVHDYIVIDMIHPDYILGMEDGYDNVINPEVFEMTRKRDFSFIMPVLFRRVGKDTGDMLFVEDTRHWKKTKDLFIMYKPINYWGNKNFNEIKNVKQSDNGEWVGETSILKDKPRVQERTDVELLNMIDAQKSGIQLFIAKSPTNFKNELTEGFDNQLNDLSLPRPNMGGSITEDDTNNIVDNWKDESKNCNPIQ